MYLLLGLLCGLTLPCYSQAWGVRTPVQLANLFPSEKARLLVGQLRALRYEVTSMLLGNGIALKGEPKTTHWSA